MTFDFEISRVDYSFNCNTCKQCNKKTNQTAYAQLTLNLDKVSEQRCSYLYANTQVRIEILSN